MNSKDKSRLFYGDVINVPKKAGMKFTVELKDEKNFLKK